MRNLGEAWSLSYRAERECLEQGLKQLDLLLSSRQVDLLIEYLALFVKWNRAYNLSAIRSPLEIVRLHLLDSLAVANHLRGACFADVGTGGGLPGIPLAIAFPDKHFTLIDSVGKKTRFLLQVRRDLSLANIAVENCRVEAYRPTDLFDGVISRAFASLCDMTGKCRHLLLPDGHFWAMKGVYPQDELSVLAKHYRVDANYELSVPGVGAQRCLLCLSPLQSSEPGLTHYV